MTMKNQKQFAASVVEMDAGKFLHMINAGAQSQVALFDESLRKMGVEVGSNWRLLSLHSNILFFENADTHQYYQAEIKRLAKGRVKIDGITELRVVESKKEGSYRKNISEMIEAISEEDTTKVDSIFNRLISQRFRSSVIPPNGLVETRDRKIRFVKVAKQIVDESVKTRLVKHLCETLNDSIKVNRGRVVEAIFNDGSIKFPITELTRRRVVARAMKDIARKAYVSEGFQNRIKHIGVLLSNKNLEGAIRNSMEFLKENQEFSLLNLSEMQTLVENTLATQGNFNRILAEHIGKVLFRTNCKVNRDAIIENWRRVARLTEYAPFVENVRTLDESKQFEDDYQDFLHMIFVEDISTQQAKAKMYLSSLQDMKKVLAGTDADPELVSGLDEYIERLGNMGSEVDEATLMEVEGMVASASEGLLDDLNTLGSYNQIPEPQKAEPEQFGGDLGGKVGSGGGDLGGALGGDDLGPAGPELPLGDEEQTPELGKEPGPGEEDTGLPPIGDDIQKNQKTIQEAVAKFNAEDLKEELGEWVKNSAKFYKEDGSDLAKIQLESYIQRAQELKQNDIAEGFKVILVANTPIQESEEEKNIDPYAFNAEKGSLDCNYGLNECDHTTWKKGMKQSEPGGQIGGKETAKGDAMGHAEEKNPNEADAGHPEAILKGGKAKGGQGNSVAGKGVVEDKVKCPECEGQCEMSECMTEDGAVCPDCGAQMESQLLEALEIAEAGLKGAGHKMDRVTDGKGVADCCPKDTDARSGVGGKGKKVEIEQPGKGVADCGGEVSTGSGKKEGMEQDGKSIAGEDQMKNPTKRRRMNPRRSALTKVESKKTGEAVAEDQTTIVVTDKPVDEVVAAIAASISADDTMPDTDDVGGIEGMEELPADGIGGEGGELEGGVEGPEGGLEGGEELPPEGELEGEPEGMEGPELPPEGGAGGPPPEIAGSEEGETEEEEEAETEEEEEEEVEAGVEEGKLPEGLKKFQFPKNGEKKDGEKEEKGEDEEEEVAEDNNVTAPTSKEYTSEKEARKDGDGKEMRPAPKIETQDYDGVKDFKAGKKK